MGFSRILWRRCFACGLFVTAVIVARQAAPEESVVAAAVDAGSDGLRVEMQQAGPLELRLRVTSPMPRQMFASNGVRVRLEGAEPLWSPGDPRLLQRSFRLALPPDTDLSSVHVTLEAMAQEEIVLERPIEPAPPVVTWDGEKNIYEWGRGKTIVHGCNMKVYGVDALYPATVLSPAHCGELREWKVVQFSLYPLQYNPSSKVLRVLTSADISIRYGLAPAKSVSAPRDGAMNELAGLLLDNFNEALPMYPSTLLCKADTYPYVILTTNAIVAASNMLGQLEVSQELAGRTVLTVTEDGRYDDLDGAKSGGGWGGGVGDEAAENLRMWLQDNYATLGIQYVLLIGDPAPASGDVPMKLVDPGELETPTDFYYADLTGTWDQDGDGIFGEIADDYPGGFDGLAEVHVGRIPHYESSTGLLDAILLKTVEYENAAVTEAWRTGVLLPLEPVDELTTCSYLGEAIRNDFAIPESWASFRVYEEDYGFSPEMTPCNTTNVIDEWVKGYGLVTWLTHGSSTSASDVMLAGSVEQLDDTRPSFTFQCSCYNGNPDVAGNLGYMLLQHGAVATVSASRAAYYVMEDVNWAAEGYAPYMAYQYSGAIMQGYRAGEALSQMQSDALGTMPLSTQMMRNAFTFNLYGDPAARVLSESSGSSMVMRSVPRIEAHAAPNGPADDQTFEIWALGPQISYTITENPAVPWLSVSPTAGIASSARNTVTLSFNSSGLALGTYSTVLRIAAAGAANSPVAIPVTFYIQRPLPELVDTWGWTWETGGDGVWFEELVNTHDGSDAARTPALEPGSLSWCSTTVTGPGALSFWWTSSMEGVDKVTFSIDGTWTASLQGTKPWAQFSKYLEEGSHDLIWHFSNSGTAATGVDVAVLDQVVFITETSPYAVLTPITPNMEYEEGQLPEPLTLRVWNGGMGSLSYTLGLDVDWLELSTVSGSSRGEIDEIVVSPVAGLFPPPTSSATLTLTAEGAVNSPLTRTIRATKVNDFVSLGEALDAPELPWVTTGYELWHSYLSSAHDGVDSAISGTPPGGKTSELSVVLEGPGVLTFWRNVMIQSGFGYLTTMIDGEPQGPPLTGLTGQWVQDEYEIAPGFHEVRWVVSRKLVVSGSWFRVGLDEVVFTQRFPKIGLAPEALTPACLPGKDAPSETFEVWNSGTETLDYLVASTVPWISVSPASGTSTGEHDVITVTYDTSSLPTGLHEGEIRVMMPGEASSRSIPVRLDIGNRVDVTFTASQDTTIYENGELLSNGAGQYIVVGEGIGVGVTRRGLMAFDLSSIPYNATIGEVTLEVDALGGDSGIAIALFAASKAWGEGTSDADGNEVNGASCTTNDATWRYCRYNTAEWTTAGGDFEPDHPLTSTVIAGDGTYTWPSTPEFVADVQRLVFNYKSNYGWFLAATGRTVVGTKQILSRQNGSRDFAPRLHVTYYMDPPPTQTVPNVVGNTLIDAQAAIEAEALVVGLITREYHATIPKDSVVDQTPAPGTLLVPGAVVDLVLSDGPPFVQVPDVLGLAVADAETQIVAAGLVVGATHNAYTTYSAGHVARQSPTRKETAPPGSPVDLVISLGKGMTRVPDVVGLTQVAARTALSDAWLKLGAVAQVISQTVPPGNVVSQRTAANTFVMTGTSVDISVSIGVGTTQVPDLLGLTMEEAGSALQLAHLLSGDVTEEYSNTVPINRVMRQGVEPGATVARGSSVSLVLSLGEITVPVPDVVGQTQAVAQNAIEQAGLSLGSVDEAYSDTVAPGLVISQDPVAAAAVAPGYPVNLIVSTAIEPVTVPDVVGLTQSAASSALTGVKLSVGTVTEAYSTTVAAGLVISQDPSAGTSVATGSAVALVISRGKATDANHDGYLNAVDVQLTINGALGLPTPGADPDVNGDTFVNAIDVQIVINGVLGIAR